MSVSLPLVINEKIANAIGALAGTLAGAGLGYGAGHIAGALMPSGVTQPEHYSPPPVHHMERPEGAGNLPTWADAINKGLDNQFSEQQASADAMNSKTDAQFHHVDNMVRDSNAEAGGVLGGVGGAVGGGFLGHHLTKKPWHTSDKVATLATDYFASL